MSDDGTVQPAATVDVGKLRLPVVVTGGSGFIGSHLLDSLCAAGIRPRVLLRSPEASRWCADLELEIVSGSLEEIEALKRLVAGAGTVFHLAGVVRAARSDELHAVNGDGTLRLLEALDASAPAARLVLVSSLAAMGPSPTRDGLDPDAHPSPVSAYGRSKLAAERHVVTRAQGRWWSIVRPPVVYGPRDTDVLRFFRMVRRGWCAVPAGQRWLTVAFVTDVIQALVAAAGVDRSGCSYHLGEPRPYLMEELVQMIADAGDVSCRVLKTPGIVVAGLGLVGSGLWRLGLPCVPLTRDKSRELLASHWCAQTQTSLRHLGVVHTTEFSAGARETWAWYRHHGWVQ